MTEPAKVTEPAKASGTRPARTRAAAKTGAAAAPDPRKLIKGEDGYVSVDGRFEVSGTGGAFYLADASRPNPIGLPTITGPFRTLAEVRAAIAAAD